ncbi:MAG TPA: hypothetical protein VLX58_09685 [Bryobacteraceae bacterium]|nr:hypothetical protein [Bryobacteraceae bacterium]
MDNTVRNNSQLFDELIRVLNDNQNEAGAVEALTYLNAAKFNYVQGSIDHMMNNLVLFVHELGRPRLWQKVLPELRSAVAEYVRYLSKSTSRMSDLSRQYEAKGGKLLSEDEILAEVDERRGSSR